MNDLLVISHEVDPELEMANIHLKERKGANRAILFEKVKGSRFQATSNLFGSEERYKNIFGKYFEDSKTCIQLKANTTETLKDLCRPENWLKALRMPFVGLRSLPRKVSTRRAAVLKNKISIDVLPQVKCWPDDGGAFITLPQVLSQDPTKKPHWSTSNIGMYRIQISGNDYNVNDEVGLHYQLHRGIGIHHQLANQKNQELKVAIHIGGPASHSVSAMMPMPEGLPEMLFTGVLAGARTKYTYFDGWMVLADADFVILCTIKGDQVKPEGPFGDHLGYYSLKHDFPVASVKHVFHRDDAVYPFTVVGRPPQEDSMFGHLVHEITKPMVPVSLPGVKELHAVDQAGVHPLLLAIGSERYTPYQKLKKPKELLTQAHSILGFGQCSLAKYLIIASDPSGKLQCENISNFFDFCLRRLNWTRDAHFMTKTTMDTLDYSGSVLNEGSKLILPAAGDPIFKLCSDDFIKVSSGSNLMRIIDGVYAFDMQSFESYDLESKNIPIMIKENFSELGPDIRLIILTDSYKKYCEQFDDFLWSVFTKSNPAKDIYGVGAFVEFKHWGCEGALVIDARSKPHHAPELKQ